MFPFFSYYFHPNNLLLLFFFFFFFLLVHLPLVFPANNGSPYSSSTKLTADVIIHPNNTWHGLMRFLDAAKGTPVPDLKSYFRRFGYLPPPENITDLFDDEFEAALLSYQENLSLPVTGKLDYHTMKAIVSPRCGVSDFTTRAGPKAMSRFAYFYGKPRWARPPPMTLTYALSPAHVIGYVGLPELRAVFRRAFARWSAAIPVNFTESNDYTSADIKIGWYRGDHGDGEAFDGVLGVLAHAFSPENGRLHLDAAERWAVDLAVEGSAAAVDLESVATHEIGHVLGMGHSSVKESVMYPSLSPRTRKVELRMDDVEGIQKLYGSNPNYRYDARLESELSSGRGTMDLEARKGLVKWSATMVILTCFFSIRI